MSDSAITTYFGKPTFHAYGNSNVQPFQGGLIYGDYMKTHNINPHSGENKPKCVQVYSRALRGRQEVIGEIVPHKNLVMEARKFREPEGPRPQRLKRSLTTTDVKE